MSDQKVLSLSPFVGLAIANPGLFCPFEILESLTGLSDISKKQTIPGDNERKKKCFAKKCLRLSKKVTEVRKNKLLKSSNPDLLSRLNGLEDYILEKENHIILKS